MKKNIPIPSPSDVATACRPEPGPLPANGRITVEKTLVCSRNRGDLCEAGASPVKIRGLRYEDHTDIEIEAYGDTQIWLTADDLIEIASALCPPWLLRKKLGM